MFDALQWLADWFGAGQDGITGFFEGLLASLMEYWVLVWIKAKLWSLKFAWGIAKSMMGNMGLGTAINTAFNALNPDVASMARYFGVDSALSTIVTALTTKFTMRSVGL